MKKIIVCILVLSVLAFVLGCTSPVPKPSLATPGFIIDDHIHYRATDQWENDFLTIYGEYNAMACILVNMNNLERGIKFANAHPDRAIPYAAINIDSPTVLEDVQKVYHNLK